MIKKYIFITKKPSLRNLSIFVNRDNEKITNLPRGMLIKEYKKIRRMYIRLKLENVYLERKLLLLKGYMSSLTESKRTFRSKRQFNSYKKNESKN